MSWNERTKAVFVLDNLIFQDNCDYIGMSQNVMTRMACLLVSYISKVEVKPSLSTNLMTHENSLNRKLKCDHQHNEVFSLISSILYLIFSESIMQILMLLKQV